MGRVYRVAGIAVDITARKEVADSLQRSHQRMRELALHLQSVREEERKRISRDLHDEVAQVMMAIHMNLALLSDDGARTAPFLRQRIADTRQLLDQAMATVHRFARELRPAMLDELVACYGWDGLGERIPVRCFNIDPSVTSSLRFLRKTPWAREKVEGLYLFMLREQRRAGRSGGRGVSAPPPSRTG